MKLSTRKISGLMVVVALSCAVAFGQQKQENKSTITVLPPTSNQPQQPAPQPAQPAQPAQPGQQPTQPGQPSQPGQPAKPAAAAVPPGCPTQAPPQIKGQAEYNSYANAAGQA